MMRLDTSGIAGWEDKCVVMEFEHDDERADGSRVTHVRLVEIKERIAMPPVPPWRAIPDGWKRTITSATARCSPADQFCRETGRRVALRRLAAVTGRATCTRLRKAAIQQYFQDRAARKREGAAA